MVKSHQPHGLSRHEGTLHHVEPLKGPQDTECHEPDSNDCLEPASHHHSVLSSTHDSALFTACRARFVWKLNGFDARPNVARRDLGCAISRARYARGRYPGAHVGRTA